MKVAVYCGTRNLYEDMVTAAKSLLLHSDVDKIYFLIEDDDFPFYLPDCIETINVSNQTFFGKDSPNYHQRWTYMVLLRVALTKILPTEIEKVLSLDVDTIVDQDVPDLWDISLDGYYFAGVREPKKSNNGFLYINNGVTLQNLKELRRDGKDDEIIAELNRSFYQYPEQDAINKMCQGKILKIPSDYNACPWVEPYDTPKIIHFAAFNPWNHFPIVQAYKAVPWSEIRGGI